MNALNVRTAYQQVSSPRLRITLCALLVLFLASGIATPIGVSASTDAIVLVGSGARAVAQVTATEAAPRSAAGSAKTSAQQAPGNVSKVDLNTASAEQLASVLKGVGSSKAKAIVRYRTEVGPFRSIAELEEVKGIGPSIVDLNKERMSVSPAKR